jgi:hypothetical protein
MSNSATPTRRTVAKSAAWTVPVIALGVAAPAASASTTATPPGLQGWVTVSESCSIVTGMQLTIDGTGSYPERGLWIFNTTKTTAIKDATVTFYFPADMNLQWSYASGGSTQWTVPAKDSSAPSIAGMTAYTTRYTGAFAFVPGNPAYSYAVGQPKFQSKALSYNYCRSAITGYARRSVSVDGQPIAFQRGPISLLPTRSAPRSASRSANETTPAEVASQI